MEKKEGHNEIVKEVMKKLMENEFICKAREVQIKSKGSRVFRSSN